MATPANEARMPAIRNDTSSVRRGLMPIRRAASRLPATARTARPYQLRDSHHHSTPMSSTLTRKNMGPRRMLYNGSTTIASCTQADDVDLISSDQEIGRAHV